MRNEVIKIQGLMTRISERDISSFERTTAKDIQKYESALRKQLYSIMKVISLLKKLIENEYLEIVYDIRNPLVIFEEFLKKIREGLNKMKLSASDKNNIMQIIENIEKEYDGLIESSLKFIESDLSYFSTIGLKFDKFNANPEIDSFAVYLKSRSAIKKQINGKVQWILSQINLLEKRLKQLKKDSSLNLDNIIKIVSYFELQFKGLVDFCIKRLDVSNHMIVGAISLQKEKYAELERIKNELHVFYQQFFDEQSKIIEATPSETRVEQTKRKVSKFREYQNEVNLQFKAFEKEFENKISEIEEKDISSIQMEKKELRNIIDNLLKLRKRFRILASGILVAGAALSFAFGGVESPTVSQLATPPFASLTIPQKKQQEILNLSKRIPYSVKTDSSNLFGGINPVDNDYYSIRQEGSSYIINFKKKGIVLDLMKNNELMKLRREIISRTLAGYKINVKEKFDIIPLTDMSFLRIDVKTDTVNIYARSIELIDGPSTLTCIGNRIQISSTQEYNMDFTGENISKFVHLIDERGTVIDTVVLIDQKTLPDVPLSLRNIKMELTPELLYKIFGSFLGKGVYWGPSGVDDGDNYNFVCNCLMRSGYYTFFGKAFIDDALSFSNGDYSSLRKNVIWNAYFKSRGVFREVNKGIYLESFNSEGLEELSKRGFLIKTGMALQLKHGSGFHSVIIGKVSGGKVETIFTADGSDGGLGKGRIIEVSLSTYLKIKEEHSFEVIGVVDPYELQRKLKSQTEQEIILAMR